MSKPTDLEELRRDRADLIEACEKAKRDADAYYGNHLERIDAQIAAAEKATAGPEIAPCLYCGGKLRVEFDGGGYSLECPDCDHSHETEAGIIAAHNAVAAKLAEVDGLTETVVSLHEAVGELQAKLAAAPAVTRERIEGAFRAGWDAYMRRPKDMNYPGNCSSEEYQRSEIDKLLADALGAVPEKPVSDERHAEIARLREWRDSVSGAIKSSPWFEPGQWAGDKEGWGYHFEVVRAMVREIEKPKPSAPTREAILGALETWGVSKVIHGSVADNPQWLAAMLAERPEATTEPPQKAMGGSDVCITCAAHCVELGDRDEEIARLKADLDAAIDALVVNDVTVPKQFAALGEIARLKAELAKASEPYAGWHLTSEPRVLSSNKYEYLMDYDGCTLTHWRPKPQTKGGPTT